jgi:hypothetical protein
MRPLLYSFPVKLFVVVGAIVAAVIILLARVLFAGVRGTFARAFSF